MNENNQIRIALGITNLESDIKYEPMGPEQIGKISTPCRIHIHSIRKRLADSDGISGKATIDGLIHAGILRNDSPKEVLSTSQSQEKGPEEKTILALIFD